MQNINADKMIVCPYCFNEGADPQGAPFSHRDVKFRSSTCLKPIDIMSKLGKSKLEIEAMEEGELKTELKRKYSMYEKFIPKEDSVYKAFWEKYGGTAEKGTNDGVLPWERPIISEESGTANYMEDDEGFVFAARDSFKVTTRERVCPYCHNLLPIGFGKHTVKKISIIGTTGSGKTVYISQFLRNIGKLSKAGLAAFLDSEYVRPFLTDNKVEKGEKLPDNTTPKKLSQPMFCDIVQSGDGPLAKHTDTIVIYDIAGETCTSAREMIDFASFVEHSDGLILLIDPRQVNLVVNDRSVNVDAPTRTLDTLHGALQQNANDLAEIPVAVCVSQSDLCFEVLPDIASHEVSDAKVGAEFDGESYNQLAVGMREKMEENAVELVRKLKTSYVNYNFFAVSAIGCGCDENNTPRAIPAPKRIEEPFLWLFKQFGFIKSNAKVKRPFKIKHAQRYKYEGRLLNRILGGCRLVQLPDEYSEFEEDPIKLKPQVFRGGQWVDMTPDMKDLKVVVLEEN